ncbi:alpha/beta hydrolase [Sulfurovum sp.]|uniref:alpha/beta hydrolase n=1 Tax=Sulfurovum sp. TaxID=1969726 RepID=UPI0025CBC29A|nr:alpha/beta hydrolase [Sulfurovum sp.]
MHHPIQLKLIRLYFAIVSRLFPSLAVVSAHRLFHYPVNTTRKYRNELSLPKAEKFTIPLYKNVTLQGYKWGNEADPSVLLVHGWSTTSRSMSHFIHALLEANYQVITYDALRHGETKAELSDLANWADSVRAALKQTGQVECIIAHSFGSAAVTVASKLGLNTKKLVLIAPIHNVITVSSSFAKRLGIPPAIVEKMRDYTWEQNRQRFELYGKDWNDLFNSSFHVPTLIFHDKGDREIGIEHSHALCQKWPWAVLRETTGLGHRKILDDEEIIEKTLDFIRGKAV